MSIRSSRATAVALVTLATFADLVAYSICVPVLPDFARRLGASPAEIGLMFASFGVTLLMVSVPMGAIHGLPVGLSIMGEKWSDAAVLRAGAVYERVRTATLPTPSMRPWSDTNGYTN